MGIPDSKYCSVCGSMVIGGSYATDGRGEVVCYCCCAVSDVRRMVVTGKIELYLSPLGRADRYLRYKITNWPGTLRCEISYVRVGRHNMAGKRYDAWFCGPDNYLWHGVQYGDNTQILRCSRTKKLAPSTYERFWVVGKPDGKRLASRFITDESIGLCVGMSVN